MNFQCQSECLEELAVLAEYNRHSVVICGTSGSGKTYCAKQYASMLNVSDFVSVNPVVSDVKSTIETVLQLSSKVVICIENIDTGAPGAAYALLKFLEEPVSTVYVVITCNNIKRVPDTILSRSAVVYLSPPTVSDVESYARSKGSDRLIKLFNSNIWRAVRKFSDVDMLNNMNSSQLQYFSVVDDMMKFTDTVSSLMWNLGHYPDNSEAPTDFIIRYILCNTTDSHLKLACNDCINSLSTSRIAQHAVLAKFVFEAKYGE